MRGKVKGNWIDARAQIADAAEAERGAEAVIQPVEQAAQN
jgi:hypothetical protein